MLRPSYSDIANKLNNESDLDINSRYTIVIAAAKRARQIIAGSQPQCEKSLDKPVSIAVEEMYTDKLYISKTQIDDYGIESSKENN